MSAIVQGCVCGSIGAPKELRQCTEHHAYYLGDRRLDAVTRIIKALCPADYGAVEPAVLESARLKGVFIDTYFSEWLRGDAMINTDEFREMIEPEFSRDKYKTPAEHAEDAQRRLEMLLQWWTGYGYKATSVQQAVFSEQDGTAGTWDVGTIDLVLDVKCVSEIQANYELQIGAYLSMDPQQFPLREGAVIHVGKDKVKLVKYDAKRAKTRWKSAVNWWHTVKEMTA